MQPDDPPGQPWTSTLPVLQLPWVLGIDPHNPDVQHAIQQVKEHCRWEHAGQPFFEGEVEPCINGRTVGLGAYFGVDVRPTVCLSSDASPDPSLLISVVVVVVLVQFLSAVMIFIVVNEWPLAAWPRKG